MQTQQNRLKPRKQQINQVQRPEYIAAVRYLDGQRELFYVRHADDLEDARKLVIAEVGKVKSLMIALRH